MSEPNDKTKVEWFELECRKQRDRIAELERQNAELRKDAERYRKWREVRGSHVGVPCACEFDDDGETLLRCCSAHKAIIDAAMQTTGRGG